MPNTMPNTHAPLRAAPAAAEQTIPRSVHTRWLPPGSSAMLHLLLILVFHSECRSETFEVQVDGIVHALEYDASDSRSDLANLVSSFVETHNINDSPGCRTRPCVVGTLVSAILGRQKGAKTCSDGQIEARFGSSLRSLFGSDIYAELASNTGASGPAQREVGPDLGGWLQIGETRQDFAESIASVLNMLDERPEFIVEVGSSKGLSAVTFAQYLKQNHDTCGLLVCVDTWLGNTTAWLSPDTALDLGRVAGYPTVYHQFLYNILHAKVDDVVIPLPLPSLMGAKVVRGRFRAPDVVYIDGCHDYICVLNDFITWYDVLRPGGILFGDDLGNSEVRRALKAGFTQLGLALPHELGPRFWVVKKPL